tara:strand:+ start:66 stop:353 length:288 start_codon:yes stop_codon:yes gene_type:complete
MGSEINCILNAVFMGVVLNIVLSLILTPFATREEKTFIHNASSLSFKGQFMHMMVHHNQVMFSSSVIIALIVGLSVYLGYKLKPFDCLMKLKKKM